MLKAEDIAEALAAVIAAAREMDAKVTVSIVDAAGVSLGLLHMPDSFLASNDYAHWKAWTVASFGLSTPDFQQMLAGLEPHVRDGLLKHEHVTDLPGGAPVLLDRKLVAAIGVSGGSGQQDQALAEAGAAAIAHSAGSHQNAPG